MSSMIGTSFATRMIFRLISDERRILINSFCQNCVNRNYEKFKDLDQALMFVAVPMLDEEDRLFLSHYSGYSYFDLNRAVKGKWTYEENGNISEVVERKKQAEELSQAIDSNSTSVGNIRVYRGVPLKYFRDYGIKCLEDLKELEGKFLLDEGFISTSLVEDDCFYRNAPHNGVNYDVMIEYLVPAEFDEGICNVRQSHFEKESEFLINKGSLAQVIEVKRDGDDGVILQALFVPKKVYDDYYVREAGNIK